MQMGFQINHGCTSILGECGVEYAIGYWQVRSVCTQKLNISLLLLLIILLCWRHWGVTPLSLLRSLAQSCFLQTCVYLSLPWQVLEVEAHIKKQMVARQRMFPTLRSMSEFRKDQPEHRRALRVNHTSVQDRDARSDSILVSVLMAATVFCEIYWKQWLG